MGYFSNGTEGMIYVDTYCERCINWRDLDDGRGPGCPVWDAHLLFAYEETDTDSNAEKMLDLLIPRVPHTFSDGITHDINGECTMFQPRDAGAAIPGQLRIAPEIPESTLPHDFVQKPF